MMNFPLEIIDQIVSNFVEPFDLVKFQFHDKNIPDQEEWDHFIHCPDPATFVDRDGRPYQSSFYAPDLHWRMVKDLRLVSRIWCLSATRLLAMHHWWTVHFDDGHNLERAVDCCTHGAEKKDALPASKDRFTGVGQWVRSLDLATIHDLRTFMRTYVYEDMELKFEGQDVTDEYMYLHNYHDKLQGNLHYELNRAESDLAIHYDKSAEHALLRRLFDHLKRLERFSVSFPVASSGSEKAECYDLQGLDEMIATIQYGLRCPAFSHLADLRLEVPCTRDVTRLAECLTQDARGRLRHLRLVIVDETGPSGRQEYTIGEEDNDDGTMTNVIYSSFPPSNLQYEYPNQVHQGGLWDFVASCRNLESLAVEATHYLNLDKLNWTASSRGLRVLSIKRVWASISSVIKLLSGDQVLDGPPAIRRVNLEDVKVYANGGNWAEVFEHLRDKCLELQCCRIHQLTYFTGHMNFRQNNRIWENVDDIWTSDEADEDTLRTLILELVKKAGGKQYYPRRLTYMEDEI